MATLNDSEVHELLSEPNYAVVSTLNSDGSVLSTIAWISAEEPDHIRHQKQASAGTG